MEHDTARIRFYSENAEFKKFTPKGRDTERTMHLQKARFTFDHESDPFGETIEIVLPDDRNGKPFEKGEYAVNVTGDFEAAFKKVRPAFRWSVGERVGDAPMAV